MSHGLIIENYNHSKDDMLEAMIGNNKTNREKSIMNSDIKKNVL